MLDKKNGDNDYNNNMSHTPQITSLLNTDILNIRFVFFIASRVIFPRFFLILFCYVSFCVRF